ncbi:glycosyltransferase family 4 protein [candidate division CSSED10-310 bacterium]|uniref:Glycosyltransferase family 4 protein n=1 Tax=candidate division CSSED10-310 bacterium TaxID=2855610 RepID=A0ABV6YTR4_UNCC1
MIDKPPHKHKTIAFIGSKGFYSEYGGVEKIVYQISTALSVWFDVIVYGNIQYRDDETLPGAAVTVRDLSLPKVKLFGAATLAFFSTILALRGKTDLYYFHACGPGFFSFIPRLLAKKVVWHFHGRDYRRALAAMKRKGSLNYCSKVKQILRYIFLKLGEVIAVCCAHRVLVLGSSNLNYLIRSYPRFRKKFIPVDNYVQLVQIEDLELILSCGMQKNKFLLSVSRLVPEKRIDLLIEAFQRIKKNCPELSLAIIGEGEEEKRLQRMAMNDSRIKFLGARPHSQMFTFYKNALLFCLCSTIEGQSLSLLEAMSCGCPCLVSNISETAEIGSESLFLFQANDVDDLTNSLLKIIKNSEDRKEKRSNATEMFNKKFSPAKSLGIIKTELDALLEDFFL